jgi:type VI secretion system protein VasG
MSRALRGQFLILATKSHGCTSRTDILVGFYREMPESPRQGWSEKKASDPFCREPAAISTREVPKMGTVDLKQLVGKLNDSCRKAMEGAAGLCLSRTNFNIEIEHWLIKILEVDRCDFRLALPAFEIDASQLVSDLNRAIDRFKTGNGRPPALSPNIASVIREAWLYASIDRGDQRIRTGDLAVALLGSPDLRMLATDASRQFEKFDLRTLRQQFGNLFNTSLENGFPTSTGGDSPARSHSSTLAGRSNHSPSLDQFTIDLTRRAAAGQIDPVLGRQHEVRQIIDILLRRRQNNPILTGEPGVGKTAVVEGLALRIAAGDVPQAMKNVKILALDLGLLQAGAGMKGEFESRLKGVIDEVKGAEIPIVLFIDEAHTMIGAGGSAGQGDAANLLKPALARGELRTIAATTWAEYKKYFEKDAALARRFQVIKVEEPEESTAIEMMLGLVDSLQTHHGVRILNEAVVDAVKLSKRYISGRQLPDKSVSLLDTTCARISLGQSSTPPAVEDLRRRIESLRVSEGILQREHRGGIDHHERLQQIIEQLAESEAELVILESQWEREQALTERIHQLSVQLDAMTLQSNETGPDFDHTASDSDATAAESIAPHDREPSPITPRQSTDTIKGVVVADDPAIERQAIVSRLQDTQAQLKQVQGGNPLLYPFVDAAAVAETVAAWTGIPVGRMVSDEIQTVLDLQSKMEESIVGQSHALAEIARCIRTSRAGLRDPRTPIGVFLLAGTSGVGKTETALTLARLLYGGEQHLTTINMSEFKEEHKVSLLMGSPPGYVGYGEGGVLTEAVRRKPYSVILLDEMEKAHPGVQDIFYQVFDKGQMKDGEGRDIDFKNTVIIMTTNAGTDTIAQLRTENATMPEPEEFTRLVYPTLLRTFKPAFLGRLSVIPYYPLADEVFEQIIRLKLDKVASRVEENYQAKFAYDAEVVDLIRSRCCEVDTGARNIDHLLNRAILPELSAQVLGRMANSQAIHGIRVSVDTGRFTYEVQG